MAQEMFDQISSLLEKVAAEKQAADGIEDPGTMDGKSSHASAKAETPNLSRPSHGSQWSDNEEESKKTNKSGPDNKSEVTWSNAPKATEQQLGQGVTAAPTGEGPQVDYKGKMKDSPTSSPADVDAGPKYAGDISAMSSSDLYKLAADLGNALAAGIVTNAQAPAVNPNQATVVGAASATPGLDAYEKVAADVVAQVHAQARHTADLIAQHIAAELILAKRAADEAEAAAKGDKGGDRGGESASPDEQAAMLAAMSGGKPTDNSAPGDVGGPQAGAVGGMPSQTAGGGLGAGPTDGGPDGSGGAGGPPPEMGQMDEQQALQQLVMALQELEQMGVLPPLDKMQSPGQEGEKIAACVNEFKRSGKFNPNNIQAKQGSAERTVRDYMKGYIVELGRRSRI